MGWHDFVTGTATEYIYGAHLKGNFDYFSSALDGGITAGNIDTDAVGAGAIAADAIGDSHMDWADTADSPKVLQIGKEVNTYQRWMIKDTITFATVTNSNFVTFVITFAGAGDNCTAGEPAFAAAPHINAQIYTTDYNLNVGVYAAGATTAALIVYYTNTASTVSTAQTVYWSADGDVA